MRNSIVFILFATLILGVCANAGVMVQDDTVMVNECKTVPVIDGSADDDCWESAKWQTIDQVWIPYGADVDGSDFTGKYKIAWSPETDKIYFLVEIIDDELVDGYEYPSGGWPDYDVVEIFIDEDDSGGEHTHDNNAFAYHITAGNHEENYEVIDLQEGWSPVDFTDHVNMSMDINENTYTWEIELTVYDDTYDVDNENNTTVELVAGKIIGLSMAYCDNDDLFEEPKTRDNFFGSVEVPESKHNNHWKNASDFGTIKLIEAVPTIIDGSLNVSLPTIYPNPARDKIYLNINNSLSDSFRIRILDVTGKVVYNKEKLATGLDIQVIDLPELTNGYYFLQASDEKDKFTWKLLVQ